MQQKKYLELLEANKGYWKADEENFRKTGDEYLKLDGILEEI